MLSAKEIMAMMEKGRPSKRAFTSKAVEAVIDEIKAKAKDKDLAILFERCFPNTLDTTVRYREVKGKHDTYVITGDINAMWLRDSTAQVFPYIGLMGKDESLKKLIAGVVNRQASYIRKDPYCNAFNDEPVGSRWEMDKTKMIPDLHERKWEIDSLCYHVRLAYTYWKETKDSSCFDKEWKETAEKIYQTFKDQQRKDREDHYTFQRTTLQASDTLADNGLGYPVNPVGLIASSFRPADDSTLLPFLIPSNFFAVVSLRQIAEITKKCYSEDPISKNCSTLANEVEKALKKYAIVKHRKYGNIFAFEVDGFGGQVLMDDPNVPSLLSLPYLGCVDRKDPVYLNTRKFVLSKDNPWYYSGKVLSGVASIHTGRKKVWPISIIIQGLTSISDAETKKCLQMLKDSHAGTYYIHESINKDKPEDYTRPWFAWANTIFGEFLLKLWEKKGF
ncbi:MAG: glycoside hydrolase family 125 protein [Lentisphaerota bacterium]